MSELQIAKDNALHAFRELFDLKRWTQNTLGSGTNPLGWFITMGYNYLNELRKAYLFYFWVVLAIVIGFILKRVFK